MVLGLGTGKNLILDEAMPGKRRNGRLERKWTESIKHVLTEKGLSGEEAHGGD